MKEDLIKRSRSFLFNEKHQTLVGKPASQREIIEAQQQLHVQFHSDYVAFIETFGGTYAGIAIYAFSNGSSLGNETVVDLTMDFRQQYKEFLSPNILETSYVNSMDAGGNPIFIEPSGHVFICDYDCGELSE
ncbi:SMI1/KNR4 family protein [Lysinibacillus sp. HST-98]|uniref:SMI1/KNR4 family protein n=1 Tax=Lysinibacillus TaxID=400634 RepID=UPI00029C9D26|nr:MULTISPECIES: SMI1/KNR4 family protein [Lysinibacillus]EKU44832.1 hypothetical protein C518_0438 [Lysinibacillus fusiformis ZB2]MBL3728154.1 SMI1/KNR4 family protein [Lysinibacillus sp. HST-98]